MIKSANFREEFTNLQAMFPWPSPAKTALSLFGIRKLNSRVKGDLLLVDHIQKLGDQIGEADESLNLAATFTCIFTKYICRFYVSDRTIEKIIKLLRCAFKQAVECE